MTALMSLNRGRLIIGERPAEDAVQCLRCRRRWEANKTPHELTRCTFCGVSWDEPLEWDRQCIMRRAWLVEARWRDGYAFGPWHFAEMVSGTVSGEMIQEIMHKLAEAEKRRFARSKSALRFEYRSLSVDFEVYQRTPVA
jgi:hypothetical protein